MAEADIGHHSTTTRRRDGARTTTCSCEASRNAGTLVVPVMVNGIDACSGEIPGGNLGTAQTNPCCWLTPIGP